MVCCLFVCYATASAAAAHRRAIGGDGLYFLQNFEDLATYPETSPAAEAAFTVDGQGEWLFLKAFQATNSSYIPDGSEHNLRMAKNGSYVVTPVLTNGVASVTFDIGRASVKVYTSTDGGTTWAEAAQTTVGKKVTVSIGSNDVNRIKVANDASKDADIDNLAVYAQTFDSPVQLDTYEASLITTSSGTLTGRLLATGGEDITEMGFVWSTVNREPTLSDNIQVVVSLDDYFVFKCTLADLREGATVYYRTYAKYGGTQTYGPVKSFKTLVDEKSQTIDQ
ncbi:MAG: hypothetical protein IJ637_04220, partial [Prevotella sp.]|nr:hypothetical protein [Prevotella sp.]